MPYSIRMTTPTPTHDDEIASGAGKDAFVLVNNVICEDTRHNINDRRDEQTAYCASSAAEAAKYNILVARLLTAATADDLYPAAGTLVVCNTHEDRKRCLELITSDTSVENIAALRARLRRALAAVSAQL